MSSSLWQMLPAELIEHQIAQIDLLLAMYVVNEELEVDKSSADMLDTLRSYESQGNKLPTLSSPCVTLSLHLAIDESRAIHLDINAPFSYRGDTIPDEAPRIKVRLRQPSWLNRATTAQLNSQIEQHDDLFSTIEALKEAATNACTQSTQPDQTILCQETSQPLVRVWFYFPSISTRSKRDDFITYASPYALTGFLYAGKPGLLCVEGSSQNIDDYMKFIKTESWGDIPAHHKKVSERHREDILGQRVFADMQEITDTVGERRGQRVNRGNMKAVQAWLEERGLGDAFARVLM